MNQQPHSIVVIIFVGLVYFFTLWSFVSQVTEESVLIIKDFGIQLRVLYRSGNEETKVRGVTISALSGIPVLLIYLIWIQFLDKDKIVGVIVHETIVGSRIRYELAFLMRDEAKLSLSFTYLYPGLADLRKVYKACADMSSNPRTRGKRWELFAINRRHLLHWKFATFLEFFAEHHESIQFYFSEHLWRLHDPIRASPWKWAAAVPIRWISSQLLHNILCNGLSLFDHFAELLQIAP